MAMALLGEPWRGQIARRGLIVLAAVLLLHAVALLGVRRELAMTGPESVTQTTLSIALLRAPPPPAVVARPLPEAKSPGPRPVAASAPIAAPAPVVEPAPAAPEAPPPEPAPAVVEPAPNATPDPSVSAGVRQLPTKGRIAYRTRYSRMPAIEALTFVDWTIDLEKSRYELWLRTVDPPGLIELRSSGELRPFGIAPFKYVERVEIANRELSVEFDWDKHSVNFAGRNSGEPMPFIDGTQDPLSLQFHLPLLAQTYPWRFTPGSEVQFLVARRRVESYSFVVVGFEPVRIAGKDIQTLKIERLRTPSSRRQVELWMAPELDWMPVRLRFVDANDEVWESVMVNLPGSEPPAAPIQQERVTP